MHIGGDRPDTGAQVAELHIGVMGERGHGKEQSTIPLDIMSAVSRIPNGLS